MARIPPPRPQRTSPTPPGVDLLTDAGDPDTVALLCRARARLCALPVESLAETMRPLPITPLPGAPAFVRGLSLIRGTPVPVIDLGALLEAPEPGHPTRFITLRLDDRRVALAVEQVVGIQQVPGLLTALPPLLGGASAEAVSAIAALDSELLLVLRGARLVPDSVWRLAGAEAAR